MPKVLMISNNYKGCRYVRLSLPMYHCGFDIALTGEEMRNKGRHAEVIVFHRPEIKEHLALAKAMRGQGKKIVMDNDDTFRLSYHPLCQFTPDAVEVELKNRQKAIKDFMKVADLVTTTTETLAKEYREDSDNVVILPNCVDPIDWEEPLRNETDKVRIGLVGSTAMEYDYEKIKDVLRKLSGRNDVQLCMFGLGDKKHRKENPNVTEAFKDDYDFWDSLDIEHQPWCDISDYPTKLNEARLDVMLIPRKDNYFNRCKSNVKFLEAAMCEIPVIAQSFKNGPYEEINPSGEIGCLIHNNDAWMDTIEALIKSKKLRRDIGRNAKQYVLDNYNIETKAHLWEDAYSKLYEN